MATKRGAQDDKLIRELYEKLDWFTFKATDEEFDPEQVQAILNLLEKLDPLPEEGSDQTERPGAETADNAPAAKRADVPTGDVAAAKCGGVIPDDSVATAAAQKQAPARNAQEAFERFKVKYNITEEDLARKNAGSGSAADDEKIVPFPAEFSEELAFDGAQVQNFAEGKNAQENPAGRAERREGASAETGRAQAAVSEAAAAGKKKRKRFLGSAWGKVAVALLAVVVVGAVYSIGTSAVQQKPFLDVVRDGINGFKVTVTGNEMESEGEISIELRDNEKVYYDSWEEVAEENSSILIPEYIPDGLELNELYMQYCEEYVRYVGCYEGKKENDTLRIDVKYYADGYAKADFGNEEIGTLIREDKEKEVKFYQSDNSYIAWLSKGKCLYMIEWNNLAEIDEIIAQMK